MSKEAVYKLCVDAGRAVNLDGLFIAKKSHVRLLIENRLSVYFGEVAGKHSDIYGPLHESEVIFVTDNPEVIKIIKDYGLESGHNPFHYGAADNEREEFEDMTILEIVEILEKEEASEL